MRVDNDPLDVIAVNASVEREFAFTAEKLSTFADLVDDHAPVHFDAAFARERGFRDRIVHGFFISSIFSGLLGMKLPGPYSVINQLSLKLHKPVLLDELIVYRLTVSQISVAARAVVLKLSASRKSDGETVVSGSATCSLPNHAPSLQQ